MQKEKGLSLGISHIFEIQLMIDTDWKIACAYVNVAHGYSIFQSGSTGKSRKWAFLRREKGSAKSNRRAFSGSMIDATLKLWETEGLMEVLKYVEE